MPGWGFKRREAEKRHAAREEHYKEYVAAEKLRNAERDARLLWLKEEANDDEIISYLQENKWPDGRDVRAILLNLLSRKNAR